MRRTFDASPYKSEETDEIDWEDGFASASDPTDHHTAENIAFVAVEFGKSPDSSKRKPTRRTAKDKELAELVHKVHLLCLLARGRIIDRACDDLLIQASLLSLLPTSLLKISSVSKPSPSTLLPLVSWFHDNFKIRGLVSENRSFHAALSFALETHEGTPEEVAALSVALFRALKLTTRVVCILDTLSPKSKADVEESSSQRTSNSYAGGIFDTSTVVVERSKQVSVDLKRQSQRLPACEAQEDASAEAPASEKSQGSKRKSDIEFEMQLEMALSATAIAASKCSPSNDPSPRKRQRNDGNEECMFHGISTAVGSTKVGSPLHWAEVYCPGENVLGRWVHIDAVNMIVDGEQKVEAAAAACKTSLRYVVAFSGSGAKDVTRRYCTKWHKIASSRINSTWWDAVLAPLRGLESGSTGGPICLEDQSREVVEESKREPHVFTRDALEDMELETKALTEPLPSNQQAYKNHHLYAIERWLTKRQMLHPKGPVLGFCSGHPVYPRSCVQTLKPRERWLREGLQVRPNETPAKLLDKLTKNKNAPLPTDEESGEADTRTGELYGLWQVEPLQLPHAVNGIVPKNERGQVEVWSEKCLPPGTIHLRLPRIFYVAKRLEIDYAPAMVGFEFRNGRCVPLFDGIVVCAEFKDAVLEAYAEEEAKREAGEMRRRESQALSRWFQLLSSIITRQRLNNLYRNKERTSVDSQFDPKYHREKETVMDTTPHMYRAPLADDHEHVFLKRDDVNNEHSSIVTKFCSCGFSIQVEEL